MPPKAFSLQEPVRRKCASSPVSLPWGDHWFLSRDDFLYLGCYPNGKIVANDEIKKKPFISVQKLQLHLRHRQIANVAEVWAKQKIAMTPILMGKVALLLTFRTFHSTNLFIVSPNWTVEHLNDTSIVVGPSANIVVVLLRSTGPWLTILNSSQFHRFCFRDHLVSPHTWLNWKNGTHKNDDGFFNSGLPLNIKEKGWRFEALGENVFMLLKLSLRASRWK